MSKALELLIFMGICLYRLKYFEFLTYDFCYILLQTLSIGNIDHHAISLSTLMSLSLVSIILLVTGRDLDL